MSLAGAGDASAAFGFLTAWGAPGAAPGQFATPDGIAVDALGHVFVADRDNNRIQEFSSTGLFLARWGRGGGGGPAGSGNGEFSAPYGVAVDGWGHVYVADTRNNRIQKLSSTGRFLARWGANGGDGTAGAGNGEFNDPRGVAVDDAGNVYVADHNNNRIQKLSSTGRFLARWGANGGDGTAGRGDGEFTIPRGVAVDHAGNVYVADKGNHRVQELSRTGAFVRRWGAGGGDGTPGAGDGQFNLPYGVAIDGAGDVYVTDVSNNRLQKFTPGGALLGKVGHNGGDGSPGSGPAEFDDPYGVAVDCRSNVYVTDEGNARVQKLGAAGPVPRCPPVITVAARGVQRAATRRAIDVTVGCDRPCTATVSAAVTGAAPRVLRTRAVRRALVPGRPQRVRIALTPAQARVLAGALRAGAVPRARIAGAARGLGGRARPVRRSVRVAG